MRRKDKQINDIARYYLRRAQEYDVSAGYEDSIAEELRKPIKLRFQQAMKGHDVLELACGTGYWTKVISATAKSVLATDINASMISIAGEKLASITNVSFQVADAFTLEGLSGEFSAAFAHWWWSHIPKSKITDFLKTLHSKLAPGTFVLFADQLPYENGQRRCDEEGNMLEVRTLSDDTKFEIVKNFPTKEELAGALKGLADQLQYKAYPKEMMWTISYFTKGVK